MRPSAPQHNRIIPQIASCTPQPPVMVKSQETWFSVSQNEQRCIDVILFPLISIFTYCNFVYLYTWSVCQNIMPSGKKEKDKLSAKGLNGSRVIKKKKISTKGEFLPSVFFKTALKSYTHGAALSPAPLMEKSVIQLSVFLAERDFTQTNTS